MNLITANAKAKSAQITPELECLIVDGQELVTVNDKLTTLSSISSDPEQAKIQRQDPVPDNHLANNFDHFSYDRKKIVKRQICEPCVRVIPAYGEYKHDANAEQSEFELYSRKVSDHLPVYLDFNINKVHHTSFSDETD